MKLRLTFLMLLAYASVIAQVDFGFKAGPSLTSYHTGAKKSDSKIGIHVGGFVSIEINKFLSIQPELLYSTKGGKLDAATTASSEAVISFGYISLPILLSINPAKGFGIQIGPELSFLLSAKAKFNESNTNDLKKSYESFDKGIAIGGSYELKNQLGFYLRYIAGLKGIQEVIYTDNLGNAIGTSKVGHHNCFQIGMLINFNLSPNNMNK